MSTNSSFFNDSLHGQPFPTTDPFSCFYTSPVVFVVGTFSVTYILLLLPLCISILYLGHKNQSSAFSHCDSFTFHMVSMEMIGILGWSISFCGLCIKNTDVYDIGQNISSVRWYGQFFFHTLTGVERYLAVVHPITYLSLKNEKWIRIRNITIGCVWLLCFIGNTIVAVTNKIYFDLILLTSSTSIISCCNLAVLYVLIRPGPVDQSEGRERVDQSKRRALYTIMIILVILMMKLSFCLTSAGIEVSGNWNACTMTACSVWINLPSSLVLPLLFLQKRKKLMCCKH